MSLPINLSPSALRAAVQSRLDAGVSPLQDCVNVYREVIATPDAEFTTPDDARGFMSLIEHAVNSIQGTAATPRGRPSRAIPAEKWKVSMRQDLALFTDMVLADPVRGNLGYGKRSALLEKLLLDWARSRGFKG